MVKGKITKDRDGRIVNIMVKGHSDFGEYGQDIVCAAVSVYLTNTINTLTELVKVEDNLEYEIGQGHFILNVDYSNMDDMEINNTTLILESLKLALTSVEDSHGQYIKIVTGEVQ